MNKIELTKKEKDILFRLYEDKYEICEEDKYELHHLVSLGLGKGIESEFGGYFDFDLTDMARDYFFENPKLKNPSILDDKKFWIGLISSVIK